MRVLVVDDEAPARERLRQLLDDLDGFDYCGDAGNGEDALQKARSDQPDIVLLDIRMPGLDGIQTAHHLNTLDKPPAVVFTTAYDEYAVEAFEARAIGYVLKPVRRKRLAAALDQASRLARTQLDEIAKDSHIEHRRQHICARTLDKLTLIAIDDIDLFLADQKYVCVMHADGETLIDESLKSLEEEFGDRFVRVHRGALAAVARIAGVEKTGDGKFCVRMREGSPASGKELIISRRHVATVRRRLKEV
ncbi:MAG: LytTR family DNA-binding domain-containing protein [Gammaproteobacteria bacterium]|nr:LytTR family DNA-binding domain-containing protein [Gammaproteobacteria bacterium]